MLESRSGIEAEFPPVDDDAELGPIGRDDQAGHRPWSWVAVENPSHQCGGHRLLAALCQRSANADVAVANCKQRLDFVLTCEAEALLHEQPLGWNGGVPC